MQPGAERDLSFLMLIVIFVLNTMPVSIMGDENIAHYFFAERNTKVIHTVEFCLSEYKPCEVELNANTHLSVMMPAQVSIADAFDISAKITGAEVDRVTVTFQGVEHSHGLLPQAMTQIKPHHFQAKGKLSYCGYKEMAWLALVTVYTERTIYETSFSFKSVDSRIGAAQIENKIIATL